MSGEDLGTLLAFFAAMAVMIAYFHGRQRGEDAEDAARARRAEEQLRELKAAAATLGLAPPQPGVGANPLVTHVSSWAIQRIPATLGIGPGGYCEVSARAEVQGLPDEVTIQPRPRWRDQEDYMIGLAVDSGLAAFDVDYCLYATFDHPGDASTFQARARQVGPRILELIVGCADPSFDLIVTSRGMRLSPSHYLPETRLPRPRVELTTADELVRLWRQMEVTVRAGIERGVLRRPQDDGDGGPYDGLLALIGRSSP
jgi:hypothetical protein